MTRDHRYRCDAMGVSVPSRSIDLDLAALLDDVDAPQRLIRELAAARAGERKALCEAQVEVERLRLGPTSARSLKTLSFVA